MIVMIALLNDGAILSIAYDNVHYKNQARGLEHATGAGDLHGAGCNRGRRRVRLVLSWRAGFRVSTVAHIQTLMYLKLSVAGHLTIFLTRTRGPFWSIRPARDPMDSRARYTNRRDSDCGLRGVHDAAWLGLGNVRLGLRSGRGSL